MSYYRLYIMDSLGKHIEDCIEIGAANDDDAISTASGLNRYRHSELWSRARQVHRFSGVACQRAH